MRTTQKWVVGMAAFAVASPLALLSTGAFAADAPAPAPAKAEAPLLPAPKTAPAPIVVEEAPESDANADAQVRKGLGLSAATDCAPSTKDDICAMTEMDDSEPVVEDSDLAVKGYQRATVRPGVGTYGFIETKVSPGIPGQCKGRHSTNKWLKTRFNACLDSRWKIYFVNLKTRQVVGSQKVKLMQVVVPYNNRAEWRHETIAYVTNRKGWAALPQTIHSFTSCSNCKQFSPTNSANVPLPVVPGFAQWAIYEIGVNPMAQELNYSRFIISSVFSVTGTVKPSVITSKSPEVRCDRQTNPWGCIMRGVDAEMVVDLNRPQSSEWAHHVWRAQQTLDHHWGWRNGGGSVLTRTRDDNLISRNRYAACNKMSRDNHDPEFSCDEYPFASTNQGASKTRDNSSALILKSHNSSGGGLTSAFYGYQNRVLNGDRFWIHVVDF